MHLEIFSERENVDKLQHAMQSLQRSMKWDEDVYGAWMRSLFVCGGSTFEVRLVVHVRRFVGVHTQLNQSLSTP